MSAPENFQHEKLRYIETRARDDKRPKHAWGGYSQDIGAAEHVHTHAEVEASDSTSWAIVDVENGDHRSLSTLIFDLDVHKAPDDFDPDSIQVPDDTAIVRSQNGGIHVYFLLDGKPGELSQSDFSMTENLEWDIDIRGSAVSAHVVAPGDIPGVETPYELVNDVSVKGVFDPSDAADRIQYEGEPLLSYNPGQSVGGGDFAIDRDVEPPEDLPRCYHRGLQLRAASPDDHPNTHKVNTLTALCGLTAGYSVDQIVRHFCKDYPPENVDERATKRHLRLLAQKVDRGDLAPPSLSTLRQWGILDDDESCICPIDYHGQAGPQIAPAADPADADPSYTTTWDVVQEKYADDGPGVGWYYAAEVLSERYNWMYVREEERLWVYDEQRGYFNKWGAEVAAEQLEQNLGEFYSRSEQNEIIERLRNRNQVHRREINAQQHDGKLVCVGNGVVDVATGEFHEHDPKYRFTRGIDVEWNPEAMPERTLRLLRGVTKRDADMWTLIQQLGHGLMPDLPHKAFIVMFGPGNNGKSAVTGLFKRFVGEKNTSSVEIEEFSSDPFATGNLPGKMLNIGNDLSGTKLNDVSMLKRLTSGGEDSLRANAKYERTYEFTNNAAMFFAGNEPPVFAEQDTAIKTRTYPIHMPYQFTQEKNDGHRDAKPGLARDIASDPEEMSGLLNLAVEGARELEATGQFAMPESPEERMEMYNAASDPIRRFVMECFEQGDAEDVVLKEDAYDVYTAMCEATDARSASANVFKSEITQQALIDVQSGRTRKLHDGPDPAHCWRYLKFSDTAEQYLSDRLQARYAPGGEPEDGATDDDGLDGDGTLIDGRDNPLGALPLASVIDHPTGFPNVTVDVLKVKHPENEQAPALTAKVADDTLKMRVVSFDVIPPEFEVGATLLLEGVEVDEYDGNMQLVIDETVGILEIQQGVGFTEDADPDDGQGTLRSTTAAGGEGRVDTAADGGTAVADPSGADGSADDCPVPADAEGTAANIRRLKWILSREGGCLKRGRLLALAGELENIPPETAERALDKALSERHGWEETADGEVRVG